MISYRYRIIAVDKLTDVVRVDWVQFSSPATKAEVWLCVMAKYPSEALQMINICDTI